MALGLSPYKIVDNGLPAQVKFSNYFAKSYELRNSSYDDLLYANDQGRLTEATTSNIFLKMNNRWCTPKIGYGVLPGVIRSAILELAPFEIDERDVELEELEQVTEMFLTNSAWLIMPVGSLMNRTLEQTDWSSLQQQLIELGGQKR